MVTIDGKTYFGNEGCTPIEVEPFAPLCSHDPVAGTDPLLLDVPVPSFVPAVPPNECACFTFVKAELDKDNQVDPRHKLVVDGRAKDAKFEVEILPDPDDCCTGKYTIAPNVRIPCLPFEIGKAVIEKGVSTGTGSIDFWLEADACTVVPHINIAFPQPGGLVPCTTELRTTPVAGQAQNTFGFQIKYRSNSPAAASVRMLRTKGGYQTLAIGEAVKTVNFAVSSDGNDCPCYTLGSGELIDLTDLATGAISNGGDVNKDDDDMLWLNGAPKTGEGTITWYGGSLGNDSGPHGDNAAICRGTVRLNGNVPAWAKDASDNPLTIPVPHVIWPNSNLLYVSDTEGHRTWTSRRLAEDGKTVTGDGVNLDMIVPSGFQWHDRGIACAMSKYVYNPSGLLSQLEESNVSPLLAPGIAVREDRDNAGKNASGLAVHRDRLQSGGAWQDYPQSVSHGLRVNYGDGLRIYGDGENHTATGDTDTEGDRQGCLEIMYGYGFRVKNDGGFLTKPVDTAGAVTLHFGNGLALHGTNYSRDTTDDGDSATGALEVDCGDGLEISTSNGSAGKVKVKLAAADSGLTFDNGGLKVDGSGKVKSHTHGRIDNSGKLMDRAASETGAAADKYKVVISGGDGTISGSHVGTGELYGLVDNTVFITSGADVGLDATRYINGFNLNRTADVVGLRLTAGGNGTEPTIAFGGINAAIGGMVSFDPTGTLKVFGEQSNINICANGDSSTITLSAKANNAKLSTAPTVTTSETGSLAIATCGWVIGNAVTRADGAPTGVPVMFIDSTTARLGPSGIAAVPDDNGTSAGLVLTADGQGTATWKPGGIDLSGLTENKIVTVKKVTTDAGTKVLKLVTDDAPFNNVFGAPTGTETDATVKAEWVKFTKNATEAVVGNVAWEDGDGKLTRMSRLSSEENVSDFEALSGICGAFYLDASEWKLPTTALKMPAGEHNGNCLLVVDNNGDVDHSLNSMYDTLAALESDGITGPIAYSGGSGDPVTFEGLSKAAFGSALTDAGSKTVVFQQGDDVATLIDGLPMTLPDDLADGDLLAAKIEGTGEQQTKGVKPVNVGNGIAYTSETGKTGKLEVGKRTADFMFHANTDTTKPAWLSLSDRRPTIATKRMLLKGLVLNSEETTYTTPQTLKWFRFGARSPESSTTTGIVQKDSELLIPIVLDVALESDGRVSKVHRGWIRYTRNGLLLCAGNVGGAVGWTNDGQSDDARAPDSNVVD